jgi:hypothetical protein
LFGWQGTPEHWPSPTIVLLQATAALTLLRYRETLD